MSKLCDSLKPILSDVLVEGNSIVEIIDGYSDTIMIFSMKYPLSKKIYQKYISLNPDVKYWSYKGSPHNKPDNGFKSLKDSEAISFPGDKPV